jgi:hypothetical protein
VFLDPANFSSGSLTAVFHDLADRHPTPATLTVFARSDLTVLRKWMDLYRAGPTQTRACTEAEERLYEETRTGSLQAEYYRSPHASSISFSPDIESGSRITLVSWNRHAIIPRQRSGERETVGCSIGGMCCLCHGPLG